MRIAIISDIHANSQALQAVRDHAKRFDPTITFWCLGDIFDRGPEPDPVWCDLRQEQQTGRLTAWIAGNHDWGLVGRLSENHFPREADRESQRMQRTLLQDSQMEGRNCSAYEDVVEKINAMPVMLSPIEGVYLAHASFGWEHPQPTAIECVDARDREHYLWGLDEVLQSKTVQRLRAFVEHPTDEPLFVRQTSVWTLPVLMIVGHTHTRALVWPRTSREERTIRTEIRYPLSLDPDNPILVNPGSVGLSRNAKDRCASYAVLDWDRKDPSIYFYRVPYKRNETQDLLKQYGYPLEYAKELEGECTK